MPRERCQTGLPSCQMHLRCLQGVKSDHLGQAICHMVLIMAHATLPLHGRPGVLLGDNPGDKRGRKGVVTRRLGDSSTFSDSFERRLGVTYTPPLLHVIAVRLKRHLLRRRSRSVLETVKLTLQIIMGTEGSCKKVMIKLSPSTATKRENIIELLNQRIPYCSLTPPALTCPFGNITVFFITTFSSTRQRLIHIFIVHFKCDHPRQSGFGHQRLY